MTFLVDANVLSEPTKSAPDGKVVEWLTANERSLVVDSIVLGELNVGVLPFPVVASGTISSVGLKCWCRLSIAFLGTSRLAGAGWCWSWS